MQNGYLKRMDALVIGGDSSGLSAATQLHKVHNYHPPFSISSMKFSGLSKLSKVRSCLRNYMGVIPSLVVCQLWMKGRRKRIAINITLQQKNVKLLNNVIDQSL